MIMNQCECKCWEIAFTQQISHPQCFTAGKVYILLLLYCKKQGTFVPAPSIIEIMTYLLLQIHFLTRSPFPFILFISLHLSINVLNAFSEWAFAALRECEFQIFTMFNVKIFLLISVFPETMTLPLIPPHFPVVLGSPAKGNILPASSLLRPVKMLSVSLLFLLTWKSTCQVYSTSRRHHQPHHLWK